MAQAGPVMVKVGPKLPNTVMQPMLARFRAKFGQPLSKLRATLGECLGRCFGPDLVNGLGDFGRTWHEMLDAWLNAKRNNWPSATELLGILGARRVVGRPSKVVMLRNYDFSGSQIGALLKSLNCQCWGPGTPGRGICSSALARYAHGTNAVPNPRPEAPSRNDLGREPFLYPSFRTLGNDPPTIAQIGQPHTGGAESFEQPGVPVSPARHIEKSELLLFGILSDNMGFWRPVGAHLLYSLVRATRCPQGTAAVTEICFK